jgi:NarL family two-component system response regulator LiaR
MSEDKSQVGQPIRILLVEDHALTRVGIKTVLKRESDLQVVGEAANGEEAVTQAEKLKPDVILMDVGMPIMDGIQAAKQIIDCGNAARVIMLTQHDNDQDILASFSAGASGYCLKDVEESRLYMAIRTVHAGDAWLDSSIASKVLKLQSKALSMNTNQASAASTQSEGDESQHVNRFVDDENSAAQKETVTEQADHEQTRTSSVSAARAAQSLDRPYAEPLSPRELEVLTLIVDGLSNQQISDKLIISLPTTKTHVRNILNKLAVDDRTQAAVHAMRRGLV